MSKNSAVIAQPVITTTKLSRHLARFNDYTPHVSKEQELANRSILRSIGASELQVRALSHRTFTNLPRWARKVLKRTLRGQNAVAKKIHLLPKYNYPHLNHEALAEIKASNPWSERKEVWMRDDNANLVRVS